MTKLILAPYDPAAPGSFRQRLRQFELAEEFKPKDGEDEKTDPAQMVRMYRRILEVLRPRLHTDDGTPVDEALEQLSANQFDALLGEMWHTVTDDTVPLASTAT